MSPVASPARSHSSCGSALGGLFNSCSFRERTAFLTGGGGYGGGYGGGLGADHDLGAAETEQVHGLAACRPVCAASPGAGCFVLPAQYADVLSAASPSFAK
jgi:hypothetical protein